jgi:putative FmdB family regulatory protein
MPIYEYRCTACGHELEVLQKISEPVLTTCPSCSAEALAKQVSAAGFQLKGSGWYATDFRNNGSGKAKSADAKPDNGKGAADNGSSKGEAKSESKSESKPEASASSGGGCGTGCACH